MGIVVPFAPKYPNQPRAWLEKNYRLTEDEAFDAFEYAFYDYDSFNIGNLQFTKGGRMWGPYRITYVR